MSENEMSKDDIDDILNSISGEESLTGDEERAMSPELSQDGIDDLLGAIAAGEEEGYDCSVDGDTEGAMDVRIYDFLRPEIFTRSDLRMINEKMDRLLVSFTSKLGSLTSAGMSCSVTSIDELTLDELMRSQPNPSVILPLDFYQPEKGGVFFTLHSAGFLTRLFLGLTGDSFNDSSAYDLNPVKLKIFKRLMELSLTGPVCDTIAECNFSGVHITPEPGIMADPLEMMLSVLINLSIPEYDYSGMVTLALPGNWLRGIISPEKDSVPFDAASDYLLDTIIQFTTHMNEREIIDAIQPGTLSPVNRRSMGTMIYEKRKETK